MKKLDVVNDMLATMGEVPLGSLSEAHSMKGAALRLLDDSSSSIQATGWWHNTEVTTLSPDAVLGSIGVPNDALAVRPADGTNDERRNIVARGQLLYDLDDGRFEFYAPVKVELIRLVAFEELPALLASYIAAHAVLRFQSRFDGDSQRRRELEAAVAIARIEARAEHIRHRRVNIADGSSAIARVRRAVWSAR